MEVYLSDKAIRYLGQLDAARCDGRWAEVPELARKVEKHGPSRTCLAATARAEADLASLQPIQTQDTPEEVRATKIASAIESLRTAAQQQDVLAEDRFEAEVCLAWACWLSGDTSGSIEGLPQDCALQLKILLEGQRTIGQSARVCAMKGAYIRGHALEKMGSLSEAAQNYLSMLPYLSSFTTFASASPQFCVWTQCLLTRLCVISTLPDTEETGIDVNTKLWFFHIWQTFWATGSAQRQVRGYDPRLGLDFLWRDVWFAYYKVLSEVLQRHWLYTPGQAEGAAPRVLVSPEATSATDYLASRQRQRAELRNVEAINESFLLQETTFPQASQRNVDMELWADVVTQNWRVLCGSSWQDQELGNGGKIAVSRNVLDILYRAAAKTFQSTLVLRHLFTLHASLSEFDIAFKAFDSYVDIVSKGKEKQKKSGNVDHGLDDDDTVIRTYAEAVRILCRFGGLKEAEKAQDISGRIEACLKHTSITESPQLSKTTTADQAQADLQPQTFAIAYEAIATSSAQWARLTSDARSRAGLQAYAVQCFGKALDPRYGSSLNSQTRHALARLLAEMRDVSGAIKVVKQALAPLSSTVSLSASNGVQSFEDNAHYASGFIQERTAIPLWHLLSLLLTARSELDTASQACDAVFEQFKDPSYLFGVEEKRQFHSDHLNAISDTQANDRRPTRRTRGVVDLMSATERESLLQVKLTQISLIEEVQGCTAAVDTCDQLLGLYARLFGDPNTTSINARTSDFTLSPPKTSRSIRHSILGRSHDSKRLSFRPKSGISANTAVVSRPTSSATNAATIAPTIQVTDEDTSMSSQPLDRQPRHFFRPSSSSSRPGSRRAESVKSRARRSLVDVAEEPMPMANIRSMNGNSTREPSGAGNKIQRVSTNGSQLNDQSSTMEPKRVLHNAMHTANSLSLAGSDTHGFVLEPQFTPLQERRHKVSLLVQVWLFAAGLYTRGTMYEDARGALEEAMKLVEGFQGEVAQVDASARSFASRGWGKGKSVDELWADVYAEMGHLAVAQEQPHEALAHYERALLYVTDHANATVALSEILLDIHSLKIPPEATEPGSLLPSKYATEVAARSEQLSGHAQNGSTKPMPSNNRSKQATPEELNRLAARDRAYGLLSSLTKQGTGWDYPEAWFTLARAYEESGQVEKAKEMLWWTVELEDTRPIRPWEVAGLFMAPL